MPIIKSAKKRARQTVVKRERNLVTKKTVKETRKQLAAAIDSGTKAKIEKALKDYQSALDTAVKKNIMHKNKAARLLSTAVDSTQTKKKPTSATKPAAKSSKSTTKKTASKSADKKTAGKKTTAKKK